MIRTADATASGEPAKTFAEFFAGIGLVHLGLNPSAWRCVYANDIDQKKQQMYEARFGSSPYYHLGDIWKTDSVLGRLTEPPFLATASFPCVDLSLAGHWKGFAGERSSTYFGFLEVVKRLGERRPKVVMLENVSGFLTSRGGDDFRRAVTELSALGYWIDALVLDAKWFVPQSRPRVFVFGFHDTLNSPRVIQKAEGFRIDDPWRDALERSKRLRPPPLMAAFDQFRPETGWCIVPFEPPVRMAYRLQELIDIGDDQDWWSEDAMAKHHEMMEAPSRERVDAYIRQGATAVGAAFRRTRREKPRTEVRFDVAGCLRTPKGGSAKQIVIAIINGRLRMRWMSAREYARLQGAPDFPITVPPLQAMYGFGDAVCVPAISWIDQNILTPVFESATDRRRIAAPSPNIART